METKYGKRYTSKGNSQILNDGFGLPLATLSDSLFDLLLTFEGGYV